MSAIGKQARLLKAGLVATVAAGLAFAGLHSRKPVVSRAQARAIAGRHAGQQRTWQLTFDVSLQPPQQKHALQMELSGKWVTTISDVRDVEYDVACEVSDARITGEGASATTADVDALRRRLSRRFWVTYRNDGAALRIHFPKDMDPSDRNLLQMLVTETQLVRSDAAKSEWTALERDGAGLYLAIYERSDRTQVIKRKMKYVDTDGTTADSKPDLVQVAVDASERRFTLDDRGDVAAFDGGDRIRIGMPAGQGGWLDVQTSTHLADPQAGEDPVLAGSLVAADVDSSAIRTHQPDPAELRATRDRALLAGHSADELIAAARAKSQDPDLPQRLAALFRQHGDVIPAAIEVLRKNGGCKLISDALGRAGTAPAVSALSAIAHDRREATPTRIDALAALVLDSRPGVDAMRAPADLLDDADTAIRSAARIVSGSLSWAGRKDHPDEASSIDARLLARWQAASLADRRDLLTALGNSAGASVVPALEAALRDSSAEVRAAAARSLRLAEGDEVNELLSQAITTDADATVRSAAIFAAGFRSTEPFLPALLSAASDPVEFVRGDAIRLLARYVDAPGVRPALAKLAEHDPKPGIRRIAQEALEPSQK